MIILLKWNKEVIIIDKKNNQNSIKENKLFYLNSNQRQIEKAIKEVKEWKVVNKTIEELEIQIIPIHNISLIHIHFTIWKRC